MLILAFSNLIHRKVRGTLSVLAVSIAIMLMLVLVGLSNGTLNEVSQRMESVSAEIVVRDRHFDLGSMSGGKLWEKEIAKLESLQIDSQPAVEHVIPVFLGRMKLGGLSQNVFGVYPGDFKFFAGHRRLISGKLFSDIDVPAIYTGSENPGDNPVDYLPLIIDQRLSQAAELKMGDTVGFGDITAHVVGVVETGVAGRVFAPINTLRTVNGIAANTCHLFFVKANPSLSTTQLQQLCELISQSTRRSATLVANYTQVLMENFRNITIFVSLVSVISLVICFLFLILNR